MEKIKTNKNSIIRMTQYRNTLNRLKSMGFERIFSENLADSVGVTSSQVRRDLGLFGLTGNKRGGYDIDELILKLNRLLGKDILQKVIVIGVGNIGRALMNYKEFEKEGIRIVAGFDVDVSRHGDHDTVPVLPMQQLQAYLKENGIKVAILCVPEHAAQQVMDMLMNTPVEGILNFAPVRLKAYPNCVVHNVNVGLELETVIYFVNANSGVGVNAGKK